VAELQPVPLGDVRGRDAFYATTARGEVAERLAQQLTRTAGCRVVRVSDHLADRAGLEEDLRTSPPFDVLLTELKAAAVDVAARLALERNAEVVFVDNRPVTAEDGGLADGGVDKLLGRIASLAIERGAERL